MGSLRKMMGMMRGGGGLSPITAFIDQHVRGHVASFSEDSDDADPCFEMFGFRHNSGATTNFGALVQRAVDTYNTNRQDLGAYTGVSNYNSVIADITTAMGKPPTTGSYAIGDDSYKASMVPLVLEMRNTLDEFTGSIQETSYGPGITAVQMSSRASTISFGKYCIQKDGTDPNYNFIAGTNAQGYAKLDAIVPAVIASGGWFRQFSHAQWYYQDYMKDYFAGLAARIGSVDVYKGTVSSIVEYYFVRESVDSVVVVGNTITINYSKKYATSPYANITTPLWIKLNLSGTSLAGKNITTSHGGKIRSMGGNIFHVSVPLNFSNTSTSFTVSETITPSYINLTAPVVTVTGNTINTDQPIKWVLFKKLKAQFEVQVTVADRGTTFSSTPYIATEFLDRTTYDYYLGYINAEGISGLVEPASFIDLNTPSGQSSNLQGIGGTLIYDLDYRYNRSLGGGMVYSWKDMSTNGFFLKATSLAQRFYADADGFGDSLSTNVLALTASHQIALNALHNGTPYIQFAIIKLDATPAGAINFLVGATNSAGNPGMFTQIICLTGNVSSQTQNDAGTSLGSSTTAGGTVATGRHILIIRQYYGSGTGSNNVKTYTENVLTASTYNPAFGTGNSTKLYIGKSATGAVNFKIKRIGAISLALMTPAQIDTFRDTLIAAIKSEAEYASLTTP